MHFDLKPHNFLYFPDTAKFKAIDFTSAAFVGKSTNVSITPGFAAPEVLQAFEQGSSIVAETSADSWSAGCTILAILECAVFLWRFASIYFCLGDGWSEESLIQLLRDFPSRFQSLPRNAPPLKSQSWDLISKLLEPNPERRLTVDEALRHPLFGTPPKSASMKINLEAKCSWQLFQVQFLLSRSKSHHLGWENVWLPFLVLVLSLGAWKRYELNERTMPTKLQSVGRSSSYFVMKKGRLFCLDRDSLTYSWLRSDSWFLRVWFFEIHLGSISMYNKIALQGSLFLNRESDALSFTNFLMK